MEVYRLFLVGHAKIKSGKFAEATKWWKEKGMPDILSQPYIKSLKCYAGQFGLGGEYDLEIWQEIENYAAMDQMDTWILEDPERAEKSRDLWKQMSCSSGDPAGSWATGLNRLCCQIRSLFSPGFPNYGYAIHLNYEVGCKNRHPKTISRACS